MNELPGSFVKINEVAIMNLHVPIHGIALLDTLGIHPEVEGATVLYIVALYRGITDRYGRR